MVDNMKQVCDTMGVMTKCINQSDDVSRTMLSKYEESAINVNKIETIVGKLMGELGTGGFMGIGDARPGMKVILIAKNGSSSFTAHGEVTESLDGGITHVCMFLPEVQSIPETGILPTNCRSP